MLPTGPRMVLTVIVAGAAMVRLCGLGDKCLWLDEALAWRATQFDLGEMLHRWSYPLEAENPPLYFALLNVWVRVFGDGEFALRLPSALAGVLAVPSAFLLTRDLVRCTPDPSPRAEWAGVLAAALLAASELQVQEARQARMYSLGTLLVLLSAWALLRAVRSDASPVWWILYAVLSVAFLYTHNTAVFSAAAGFAFATAYLYREWRWPHGDSTRANAVRRIQRLVVVTAVVGAAYLPAAVVLAERSSETTGANAWLGPVSVRKAGRELSAATLSQSAANWLDAAGLELLPALVGTIVLCDLARRGWAGALVCLFVTVPLAAVAVYSIRSGTSLFLARYLTFCQAVLLVGIAIFVATIPRTPVLVGLLVVGLMGACGAEYREGVAGRTACPGARGAAEYIRMHRALGELVFTQRIWTHVKFAYYSGDGARPVQVAAIPSRRLHGAIYLEDREVISPAAAFRDDLAGFWFVSSSGYGDTEKPEFPLPGRWRCVEVVRFAQDYWWECDILVAHYQRE